MKRVNVVLISFLIMALVFLITPTATLAEPTSPQLNETWQQQIQERPSQTSKQAFLYWFKQCERLQGQDALSSCEQAIKINPHVAATWINHGQKLFGFGQYSQALISFDNALLLKPDYSLGLANRCGILSVLGENTKALDACEMALLGDQQWGTSGQVLAWNNRGNALLKMERYEEALASFQKSLAIDPDDAEAQQYRHVVLNKLHKKDSKHPSFPDFAPHQKDQRIAWVML